jgi:hypothetical protein
LTNSVDAALPVASVDGVALAVREPVRALLRDCHEINDWQALSGG